MCHPPQGHATRPGDMPPGPRPTSPGLSFSSSVSISSFSGCFLGFGGGGSPYATVGTKRGLGHPSGDKEGGWRCPEPSWAQGGDPRQSPPGMGVLGCPDPPGSSLTVIVVRWLEGVLVVPFGHRDGRGGWLWGWHLRLRWGGTKGQDGDGGGMGVSPCPRGVSVSLLGSPEPLWGPHVPAESPVSPQVQHVPMVSPCPCGVPSRSPMLLWDPSVPIGVPCVPAGSPVSPQDQVSMSLWSPHVPMGSPCPRETPVPLRGPPCPHRTPLCPHVIPVSPRDPCVPMGSPLPFRVPNVPRVTACPCRIPMLLWGPHVPVASKSPSWGPLCPCRALCVPIGSACPCGVPHVPTGSLYVPMGSPCPQEIPTALWGPSHPLRCPHLSVVSPRPPQLQAAPK